MHHCLSYRNSKVIRIYRLSSSLLKKSSPDSIDHNRNFQLDPAASPATFPTAG